MKTTLRSIYTKLKHRDAYIAFSSRVSPDSVLDSGVRVFKGSTLGSCKVLRYTYIGSDCDIARTEIGPFTSFGPQVLCGLATHPLEYISTYPGFYSDRASGATWFGANHEFADLLPTRIGADVWIGARAIIIGGVNIGHGAVIGAGAIVTKDVPPHAIAVGVPAKVIRYRFERSLSQEIINSRWWEAPVSALRQASEFADRPRKFLDALAGIWVYEN